MNLKNLMSKSSKPKTSFFFILSGIIILLLAAIAHPFDMEYKNFIQSHKLQDPSNPVNYILDIIRTFGKGDLLILVAVILGAKGLRKTGVKIAIAMIIMAAFVNSLKYTVRRERPNHSNNVSFPSGDTATASSFFAAASADYANVGAGFLVAPAVGFVRTYDNYHYLSDVIAGLAFGIISAGLAFFVNFQPFTFMERRIKPRLYLVAAIIMALVVYLPDAIKGGGERFNFMVVFGPALFIWLATSYSRFFCLDPINSDSFISKPLLSVKSAINKASDNKLCNISLILSSKSTFYLVLSILLILLILVWNYVRFEPFVLSSSGIIIGLITGLCLVKKQFSRSSEKKATNKTLLLSLIVTLIFVIVSFVPSYRMYETFCKKIATSKSLNE